MLVLGHVGQTVTSVLLLDVISPASVLPQNYGEQNFPRCKPSGTVGFILVKDYSLQNGGNVPRENSQAAELN